MSLLRTAHRSLSFSDSLESSSPSESDISLTKELIMFTRNVTLKLNADSAAEFARLNENEIIPLLHEHEESRDEVAFVAPERSEPKVSSRWKSHYYVSSR
jgi:hypothetical protein